LKVTLVDARCTPSVSAEQMLAARLIPSTSRSQQMRSR
jgi:hypothetical protein